MQWGQDWSGLPPCRWSLEYADSIPWKGVSLQKGKSWVGYETSSDGEARVKAICRNVKCPF